MGSTALTALPEGRKGPCGLRGLWRRGEEQKCQKSGRAGEWGPRGAFHFLEAGVLPSTWAQPGPCRLRVPQTPAVLASPSCSRISRPPPHLGAPRRFRGSSHPPGATGVTLRQEKGCECVDPAPVTRHPSPHILQSESGSSPSVSCDTLHPAVLQVVGAPTVPKSSTL